MTKPLRVRLLVLFGFLALPLGAEVFWRLPKTSDSVLRQTGGACLYTTGAQVNGTRGTLSAYAFTQPAASVGAALARRFGLEASPSVTGGACLTLAENGRLCRLFVLPAVSGNGTCAVLAFEQSLRQAAQTRHAAPDWPEGLPPLNATPTFSAVCEKTRTAFVTAETDAAPESALREAVRTLTGAGWCKAGPGTATFQLFADGAKQCVVLAKRSPKTGQTLISLLQREGATP